MEFSDPQFVVVFVLEVANGALEFLFGRGSAFGQPRGELVDAGIGILWKFKRLSQFLGRDCSSLYQVTFAEVDGSVSRYSASRRRIKVLL